MKDIKLKTVTISGYSKIGLSLFKIYKHDKFTSIVSRDLPESRTICTTKILNDKDIRYIAELMTHQASLQLLIDETIENKGE